MTSIIDELRAWGLTLPGVHRKSPWPEHDDLAVNDKTFAYLPAAGQPFKRSVSCPTPGAWRSACPSPNRPVTGSAKAAGSASNRPKPKSRTSFS